VGGEHPAGPHRLRSLEEGDGLGHQEDGAGHQGEGVGLRQDEPGVNAVNLYFFVVDK